MSNPIRALMLGALLVVMSLATTAKAQEQPTDEAVERFRAGERASWVQPTAGDAVERFRAGERASQAQPAASDAGAAPPEVAQPARPPAPGTRIGLLVMLGVLAAALAAVTATRAARRVRTRQAF
jgi:hypothetical protein